MNELSKLISDAKSFGFILRFEIVADQLGVRIVDGTHVIFNISASTSFLKSAVRLAQEFLDALD